MILMLTTKTGEETVTKSKKKEKLMQKKNVKKVVCLKIIMKWLKHKKEMILMFLFIIKMGLLDKQIKEATSGDLMKPPTTLLSYLKSRFQSSCKPII